MDYEIQRLFYTYERSNDAKCRVGINPSRVLVHNVAVYWNEHEDHKLRTKSTSINGKRGGRNVMWDPSGLSWVGGIGTRCERWMKSTVFRLRTRELLNYSKTRRTSGYEQKERLKRGTC